MTSSRARRALEDHRRRYQGVPLPKKSRSLATTRVPTGSTIGIDSAIVLNRASAQDLSRGCFQKRRCLGVADAPSFHLRYSKSSMQLQAKIKNAKVALQYHPKLQSSWPPQPGGAFAPGTAFPLDGSDVLERVFYYAPVGHAKANVSLKTAYRGRHHTRDLLIDDPDFAQRLASTLREGVGQTIADIGKLEIEY
jgi:hypothetical protein